MRIGKTTSRGWVGVKVRDGRVMFGVVPRWVVGIDFRTARVLPEMVKKADNSAFESARASLRHWWSLGRPGPLTLLRNAVAYGRWQRANADRRADAYQPEDLTPPPGIAVVTPLGKAL